MLAQADRSTGQIGRCVCVVCGVHSTAHALCGPGCTCVLCGRPQEKERQWDSIPHWWLRGPKLGEAGWALIMQRRGRILVFSKWQTLLGKRKEADTSCSLPKLLTRRESSVRHGRRKEQNIPFPGIIEVVCTVLLGEKKILPPNQHLQNYVLKFSKEKSHYPMWILKIIIFVFSSGLWVLGFDSKLESQRRKLCLLAFSPWTRQLHSMLFLFLKKSHPSHSNPFTPSFNKCVFSLCYSQALCWVKKQ